MSNNMPNSGNITAMTVTAVDNVLQAVSLTESQLQVARSASAQIINVTSRMGAVQDEVKRLKAEMAEDPRFKNLREYKKVYKELNKLHQDAVANFNGIMKIVLADAPGKSLNEKIAFAQDNKLLG